MRNVNEKLIKSAVAESINTLISRAEKEYKKRPNLSRRYAKMAWALVKKHKVRLTSLQKTKFCKRCHEIWIPSESVSVSFDHKNNLFRLKCRCGYVRRAGSIKKPRAN